ncbi:MAG TPA: cation:proton antiporter [Candidatus Cloacimonadota bacterium]|nr:cation:proton antiporter [Candidatus Cloacimonadota bacterium]
MSSEFLLFFLGVSALLSLLCSRGATLIKSPLIVGYIIAGAILGPAILGVINNNQIVSMDVINTLTLSFIGFGVGGELRWAELKKLGKAIIIIVLMEATATFVLVALTTALVLKSIPMGIIYGALASATAPAGTVDVIRQYKAKGSLTTTLYAVMGLDDIYALLIYTISIPLAIIFLGGTTDLSIGQSLVHAGWEVVQAISIGSIMGFLMISVGKWLHDRSSLLIFTLAVVLLNCGISSKLGISPILLNMSIGIVAVNKNKLIAGKIFSSLGDWSPPIYVWFFVLIGTRLNFHLITTYALLVVVYILSRTFGKWSGAFTGATLAKAPEKTIKYLGFTLLSQAGVAIGLALAATHSLEKMNMQHEADQVIGVMTATTFLIMLIGPVLAKIGLFKAGEATLDTDSK